MLPSSGQNVPETLLTNLFELLPLKVERGGHDIVRDWKLRKTEIKPERQTYILWAFQVILLHFFFCSNLVKYSPKRKLASHTLCPSCVKYLQKARSLRDVKLQLIFPLQMSLPFLYTCSWILSFILGPSCSNFLSSAVLTGNCHT